MYVYIYMYMYIYMLFIYWFNFNLGINTHTDSADQHEGGGDGWDWPLRDFPMREGWDGTAPKHREWPWGGDFSPRPFPAGGGGHQRAVSDWEELK